MDVTLPNGKVIRGVPEGTSKEAIKAKAIAAGIATEADFASVAPAAPQAEPQPTEIPPGGPQPSPTTPMEADDRVAVGPFATADKGLVDPFGRPVSWRQAQPPIESLPNALQRGGAALKMAIQQNLTFDDQRLMKSLSDSYPGVQFADDGQGNVVVDFTALGGGRGYLNPPGLDQVDAQRAAMTAAQFAPGASVATRLGGGLLRQGVLQGAAAGTTEVLRDLGSQRMGGTEDVSLSNVDTDTVMTTAAFGAAAPAIGAVASKVIRRMIPGKSIKVLNDDGTLTDDALRAIDDAGADRSVLNQQIVRELQKEGVLTPEQARQFNLFRSQGVNPTRANLTQTADDWQFQQEGIKRSGPLREAVDAQDAALIGSMDDIAQRTKGAATDRYGAGEEVYSAITRRALDEDAVIGSLYNQARQAAGPEQVVRFARTADKLKEVAGRDELTGGMVKAVKSELQRRGLIDKQWRPSGRTDVRTAEEIRQTINSFYDGASPQGRMVLKQLKDALDDDVMTAAGRDLFLQARKARTEFSANIGRARGNKFDMNTKSLVEDVLANKISPDVMFDRVMVGRQYGARDLEMLRNYLVNGTPEQVAQGQQALNTLRRQTVEYLLESATKHGGRAEGGAATFSANKFRQALDRIGDRRLAVLFDADEMKELMAIKQISDARIPLTGTQQGEGPTAQAVKSAAKEIAGDTILERLARLMNVRRIFGEAKRAAIAADPIQQTVQAFDRAANLSQPQNQVMTQGFRGLLE